MNWRWKAFGLLIALFMGGVGYLMFVGNPRMKDQPNIRSFQARMPTMPAGVVPVHDVVPRIPTTQQAESLARIEDTAENLAAGQIYYGYYCGFCHGSAGDGTGPVGLSYFPTPADFRSDRIRNYSDGQLYRAMLLGTGHEPMANRIIPPYARPSLVLYVRHLSQSPPSQPSNVTWTQATTRESR